jgi:hypothetical protein
MERMKVAVRVHPIIREFLIDTTGKDTIFPEKGDLYWGILAQNLETPPNDYIEPIDTDNYIYIELPNIHGHKYFCNQKKKSIYIDTLFRWYLSKEGQNKVNSILRKNFKNSFHCFVQGAVVCNPDLQQKEAIEMFCDTYNLSMDKITPDMLFKSWNRSPHKEKTRTNKFIHSLIFF